MKKTIIILASVLVFVVSCSVAINAIFDINNSEEKIDYTSNETIRNDAQKNKKVELPDNKQVDLSYKSTIESENSTHDVYEDDKGNKYTFSENGDKMGFLILDREEANNSKNESNSKNSTEAVDDTVNLESLTQEEKLALKAETYAKEYYGDKFDGYELVEFSEGSKNSDGVMNYNATFSKCYGEDKFVRGETCYVSILPDGFVESCTMSAYGKLDGFNPTTLNGIKYNDIEEYVDTTVKNSYLENLANYKIPLVSLNKIEGKFILQIPVEIEKTDGICTSEIYYYEIPQ